MRTDKRTLVALDTCLLVPFRHIYGYAPLFICRSPAWECAVFNTAECADRKLVSLLPVHRAHNLGYEFWFLDICPAGFFPYAFFLKVFPVCRHIYFY